MIASIISPQCRSTVTLFLTTLYEKTLEWLKDINILWKQVIALDWMQAMILT